MTISETHTQARQDGAAAFARLKLRFERHNQVAVGLLFTFAALFPLTPGVEGWMASQASLIIIYIIAAQGVSLLVGYTGLVTVGHGGFLAIGAYTSALLTKHFGVDLFLGLIAGGLAAGLIGYGLGFIFLRLSGAFMAIGTLGFAFFIGAIVNNVPIFEGRTGINLPANHIFGIKIGDFGFYLVALAALASTTLLMYALVRSGVGRAFMALRDAEKAAESCGINRVFYRTLAFSISAAITGVAGALNGHITNYISSEVYADIWYSVDFLVACVVGGSATLMGPFIGGAFIVMVPFFFEKLADFSYILKGIVLIAVLLLAPAGVADLLARPIRAFRRRQLAAAGVSPDVVAAPATPAPLTGGG
ncbi:MAG: branched-chain amino acid ABC transporter permease [Rhodospirillales bacterium]|nr:branched-chain amino acid ABC transporter permease [Rhodospirillales bacterium]